MVICYCLYKKTKKADIFLYQLVILLYIESYCTWYVFESIFMKLIVGKASFIIAITFSID